MELYANGTSNTQILGYKIYSDSIDITYRGGVTYRYSYAGAGEEHVEQMKNLARMGSGLSEYIARHARCAYDSCR